MNNRTCNHRIDPLSRCVYCDTRMCEDCVADGDVEDCEKSPSGKHEPDVYYGDGIYG
ncbi:hypothetical protein LCGC14_0734590 [marine sediment metagenome]|uniref:Uncharacterized protein n=1 Tax=marine sediment metagenome TaxID=412755 RepID=A0A0F9QTI3_9ZZZZ